MNPSRWIGVQTLVICLLAAIALVLPDPTLAAGSKRPRVGLVLGGGGARGVAHIGVLQVLEEMRIPISCVAGTSMGSLVGGAYAAGVPIDEMTARLGAIDWQDIFSDDPARTEKPYRAKRDDAENLFRFELGQQGAGIKMASGTTSGYKFEFLLREMVQRAGNFADQDFDLLPIPYRAMATNIEDGTAKEFRHGDLVKVMRASMSVPGVLAPVQIDDVLYVDGGLLQNVPVAAARNTCADVVIAVNVGSPLLGRDELNSVVGVTLQMVAVLTEQNVRESIASLKPTDILIEPELGDFSAADFEEGLTLIPKGRAAALAHAEALRRLSVSEEEYSAWRASVAARLPEVPKVTDVQVVSSGDTVNTEVIERQLDQVPGIDLRRVPETDFSIENLNRRLEQVYGRGDFERMDYRMVDRQGSRTVEVQGVEKSWGPNYLKLGLGLASDSDQTRFNVSLSHRMTWLNSLGAEWRNDLQIGYHKYFSSEFFQPLSIRSDLFVAPWIELSDEPISLFLNEQPIGDYRVSYARAHLDVGGQNNYGELRLGAFAGTLDASPELGIWRSVPRYDLTQVGYRVKAVYDQIDSPTFGREGLMASLDSFGTVGGWGSDDNYNKTEVLLLGAKGFGKHALQLAAYAGGSLYGEAPVYDPFLLGGFLRGSGYQMDQLIGRKVGLARAVYSYELASLPSPIGRGLYVGASLEATYASLNLDIVDDNEIRPSASIFIGADTFLGPSFLAFGQSFAGGTPDAFYFILGNP